MKLSDLIPEFVCEDEKNECKARLDRTNLLGWLKTIDGFANNKGGRIYLGVEDKSYDVIGFDAQELDSEKLFLFNAVNQHFPIAPPIAVKAISYSLRDKERYILAVNVMESPAKPLMFKYKEMPMIFLRRDGFTNPATMEEILEMAKNNQSQSFDVQATDIDFDLSDFTQLSGFYKERTEREIKEKDLASLGFFTQEKKLRRGALLFKDDYKGEETKVTCTTFNGLSKGDDYIVSTATYVGNLIGAFHFIWEYLKQRMNHGFVKYATGRKDIDAYPSRALFETIINALVHRDYLIDGTQISVDLFKNRLAITSPGKLIAGGSLEPTYDLSSFPSSRRNELLAKVFVHCKAMEAKGTGFEKISEDYKAEDAYHKPFIFSKNNHFTTVLPDITYQEGLTPEASIITVIGETNVSERYSSPILLYCLKEKRTVNQITAYLNVSNSTYFRRKVLDELVQRKYLLLSKEGDVSKYLTNREMIEINQ